MTAVVRSVQVSHINGGAGPATRGNAATGDLLIAFQSADSGTNTQLTLAGGWTPLASFQGGTWPGSNSLTWAGTRVWSRVAAAGEAATYEASHGPVADGMVTIVAVTAARTDNIVISLGFNGLGQAPDATPTSSNGLQLRYSAGVPSPPGAAVAWSVPSAFTTQTESQAEAKWTAVVLASAPIVSTTPVGSAAISPSPPFSAVHGITVLIAGTETPTPEPPVYPPFTPGKGSSKFRYTFRNMLTRAFLGDLDLTGVSFDARLGQPGSLQATIPIPSGEVGDKVAQIIPRDETQLSIGPGVISCEIYREGDCWGEYWITGAQPRRSRGGTPVIALRGSTLEAYLAHVELQSLLAFAGQDQIVIARDLLNHLMSQPYANIGLVLQTGTSGVTRDRTYEADESTYGQRLQELGEVEDGFEWAIRMRNVAGALQRSWEWGYPRIGQQSPPLHTFVDSTGGGDILDWSEDIDALRGATRWRARGGTSGSDASTSGSPLISAVHEATAHLNAGWPRLDRTINKSSVTQQSTLEEWAAYWAATAPGALRVDSLTVALGGTPTFTPNSLGDTAKIYLNNEWHTGGWRTRRIIGMQITPPSKADGLEEAQLILEGREVA